MADETDGAVEAEAISREQRASGRGKKDMRTLIVDDSRFLRERLKQMMRPMGWDCVEAVDGAAALDVLRTDADFELMLLDVNMPEMGGLECVRRLRSERIAPAMKVMMVTTESDMSFVMQALDYGADEFLMKPMTAESLQSKLLLLRLGTMPMQALRA
jgi:two-component system, chemotaxis family, chemotaxis protein CheY